jgi:hypothetical protein
VAEVAAPEELDRWFGLSRVLVNAGLGAGGLLGGLAATTLAIAGYQAIIVLNALSFVLAAGMLTRLRMPSGRKRTRRRAPQPATQAAGVGRSSGRRGDSGVWRGPV